MTITQRIKGAIHPLAALAALNVVGAVPSEVEQRSHG